MVPPPRGYGSPPGCAARVQRIRPLPVREVATYEVTAETLAAEDVPRAPNPTPVVDASTGRVFLFLAQIVVYAMALYGHTMTRQGQKPPRLVSLVYFLCVVNLASAQAFWRFLRGQKQVTWNPRT